MIVITLNQPTLKYLAYVMQTHCEKGLELDELGAASAAWNSIQEAQEILSDGTTRSAFAQEEKAEAETTHIKGPVSVVVNGDMTLPL